MYYIGVDLGGSNMAVGVVTAEGKILHQQSAPTGVGRAYTEILSDMADLIEETVAAADMSMDKIAAIGIGSPGVANPEDGSIVFANNLFWHDVPVRREIGGRLNKNVYIDNDANVACLAEVHAGACKGKSSAVLLTLGTGVGGGLVIDGKLQGGSHHVGAEVGHMILLADGILCTCGNHGCFERYASATALIQQGKQALEENPEGWLAKQVDGNPERINAKIIIDGAKAGDWQMIAVFEKYVHYLALGIVSLCNILDPEVVALGGGVSHAGQFLLDAVRGAVAPMIMYKTLPYAEIVLAELGNDAGVIGAAMLGKQAGNIE